MTHSVTKKSSFPGALFYGFDLDYTFAYAKNSTI